MAIGLSITPGLPFLHKEAEGSQSLGCVGLSRGYPYTTHFVGGFSIINPPVIGDQLWKPPNKGLALLKHPDS